MSTEAEAAPAPAPRGSRVPPALLALVAPEAGMERQAKIGGWKLGLFSAMACALLAAGAVAHRVDARDSTMAKLEMTGQLQNLSDRQIEEETRTAERKFMVLRVGWGVLEAPVELGFAALSVVVLSWFLRGRIQGKAVAPVAAAALLPLALGNLLDAIAAFRHASIPPEGTVLSPRSVSALWAALGHPIPPPWMKLGNAFDFFSLWAAVLLGFGLAAAGKLPARRALIGTMVAWACWRLFTNVAIGG